MDREDIEYIESGELGHSTGDGSDAENMLSERIVRKGSRWQVQSEKGRNMGTYDTRKEAEDRLRDIEMFKHMKESGNHSVNESLQDEIERLLPVSDNYLEQSAQYILPDGRFLLLDDPDTGTAAYDDQSDNSGMHGDEFEYLKAAGLFGTWQEYAKYRDSQGWIEASDSHPEEDSCIRIAYVEPTVAQYRSIERFADHCLDSWGYIKVEIGRNQEFYRAFCLDDSHCPDYMDPSNEEVGNFTGYDIARRIRNFFHRVDNVNESMEGQEVDSEGNALSSEQVEFFRDSKIRTGMNGYGNLRVCYNGQPRDWGDEYRKLDIVQFKFKDKPNDFGFFFTISRDTASKYAKNNPSSQNGGIVKSVYLNIVNPLVFKNMVCTRDDFLGELKDNNVDIGFDVKDSSRVRRRNVWEWIDLYGSELRKNIVKAGYDGVIFDEGWDKTIVAFNPNQIKSIDNKNPTNSNNINEDYEPDVYYRGYDSRYGVFDSDNQYGQLYTWVTDEPEYAIEYAENNEYGKVAKVRVTCDDRKIGGVSDLPDDADYYDPGDDIFREYILSNGLEGYGFTAGEYDDFCMCVSKDCVEVVDPDFKVGDEVDESLREGNRELDEGLLDTLKSNLGEYKYDFRQQGWHDMYGDPITDFNDDWEPNIGDWYYVNDTHRFSNDGANLECWIDDANKVFTITILWSRNNSKGEATRLVRKVLDLVPGDWKIQIDNNLNTGYWKHLFDKYYPNRTYTNIEESLKDGNEFDFITKVELETLNNWLNKYDFEVELITDSEALDGIDWFSQYGGESVGMFLADIQDNDRVFPIALNKEAISRLSEDKEDLIDGIRGTLWHEAGHGIYSFLRDMGYEMPPDEEECVEDFARYVEDSVLYGILEDYMKDYGNTDEPLNESKADQQKFIDKFGQDVFDLFNKSRDRLRNSKVSTDILYHVKNTSVEDMKNILHNLQAKVKTGDNNVDLTKIQGKYNFLGSRDGYDVYEPLDVIASMSLGVGTGWCTTGRYGHAGDVNFKPSVKDAKEHWDEYTSEGVRFFYFLQNGIGKYALALYPKMFEVGEYIDSETYLKSCNFELYNQEDRPEYKGLSRIPYDLIGDDLVINTIVAQNGLILSEDGKKLMRAIKSISSCTIPDGVEEIKDMAFAYCTSLVSVTIPNSVKEIGIYAFDSCTSLTSINISNNVKEIGYSTFHGCASLTSVMIPNGVDKIGVCAFWGCESLSSISIPNSVTRIDNRAFAYCKSLESISIPEGVTIIQSGTFSDCTSLTTVNIPNSMKTIGESAFDNCASLTSLIIPDSVNSIDDYAFIECPNLTVKTNNKYVLEYCNEHDIPVEPLNEGLVESEVNTDVSRQYQKDSGNLGEGYFEGDFNEVYDNMLQYESKEPALGPAFITRDGTFINLERFHGDIFGDIDDYEGEDFYTLEDNFGLIKLNGGNSYEPFPYVDLWTRPNEMQSRALVEWMYFLMERGKKKVLVNTSSSDRIYEFGKTLPEEILKDAFRDMGEQLQERVFDRGIDLGKYVLKYVRENLDDLIQSELDNVYNTYGFTEEDIENEIARINSIHSAQDYIDYVGDGIDWVEDIVLKELQDRFLDIVGYVEDKVYELISSRDGMDCHLDVTHSFSPGDFPSHYLTVTKEVGDDIEERTIRIGDGHDNGRNDSDLEIDFEDMLDCPDYYDRDIEDLVADLDSSLGESLDSSVINEAKEDWEKFREWCGDDSIYNRFVRVQKRLAGKQRDIYYWMGLEKSLGKHGAMQELLAMLRDVESTPTKREREASARDGATLLYDSNGWKVYKIETLEASQKYGKDTTWCISGDGEGGNYDAADFWEGNEDQTYFFIHGDDKYALIWERGASDWDIWNAMDGKEPYVKGAPAVPGLPDISRPSPELLKGIAKCLGIPAGDILDIHVADYDDELSELFYDYDASGNYIVDTKGGTCYVIDTLGDFEDVTQDIEDALEEYDEE